MHLMGSVQAWNKSIFRQCRTFSSTCKAKVTNRRASLQLPSTPARTRFAPSPTGYLHLGSLRTALFNYLVSKATGGQFILRIEDTDKVSSPFRCCTRRLRANSLKRRTIADAEERLYKDLRWAGLEWDEGMSLWAAERSSLWF